MPPNTSYPSPNATQMGEGLHPFYHPTPHHMASSAEHHMPSAEEQLQMSAHLSREVPPNMTGNIVDGQAIAQRNHNIHAQNMRQGPMGSPQQIAQSGLNSNHDPNLTESPKKRSKVSRACDECRRKKVRTMFRSPFSIRLAANQADLRRFDAMLPLRMPMSNAQAVSVWGQPASSVEYH